jgi:tape measure domain-containing protein
MTGALRGVAGLAAMTGSSFDDVGQIFTTVAGNGKLMSENLMQFSSRGINVAAALAKQMGKSEEEVRKMITKGKIDFKTFATAMDQAFGAHAKDANKTYAGSLDNMHAAMSRIGADFATPKFAGLRDIFNALTPAIDKVHAALKPVIDLYASMQANSSKSIVNFINSINFDGLTKSMPLIADTIKNIFTLIGQIVKPIKDAFVDIFPVSSVDILVKIATAVDNFSKKLLLSAGTMAKLKQTFKGVFSVFDIFLNLIKAGVKFVRDLFNHFATGSTNIAGFTSKIGTAVIMFDTFLKKGDYFNKFFAKLEPLIEKPIDALKAHPQDRRVRQGCCWLCVGCFHHRQDPRRPVWSWRHWRPRQRRHGEAQEGL